MKKQKRFAVPGSIGAAATLCFVLLISAVILLVSTLSYTFTIRDLEDISATYTQSLIGEITTGIDSYVENIKSMSTVICDHPSVQNLMALTNSYRGKPLSAEDRRKSDALRLEVQRHLKTVAGTRGDITNAALISKFHDIFLSDPNKQLNPYSRFNETDWFLKPLSYKDEIVVSPPHVQNMIHGEYLWVISVSRAVIDRDTGEVTGVLVIDLNFQSIENICNSTRLGQTGYVYIIDENRNLIYHPQQQLIYSGIKTEPIREILSLQSGSMRSQDNRIYMKSTSSLTKWTTVGVVNSSELVRDRLKIIRFYYTLGGFSLLLAAAAALAISLSITRPVKELETTMHLVEEGNLTIQANTEVPNEIGHLGKTFNTMVDKIRALMATAVKNEEDKRKSEINALQAQINPHFLYNTLDTIIWMSASGRNDDVTEVTSALARLFRTSISQEGPFVPLRNEIDNIRSYLTIQKYRYGDKLSYEVEIGAEYLDFAVPKLVLQPIVENALYHGIKVSPENGMIRISASRDGDRLVLTVSDNGVGMSQEQLDNLFKPKKSADAHGIGVRNVDTRIKLCCGDAYGLHYSSRESVGTRAEIWLPARKEL